ncbi:MAG: S8 family serine peptidase [Acidobacteriota bacterium]|nr:S8 family serine peptidase [Acidobacteriota bacterium]
MILDGVDLLTTDHPLIADCSGRGVRVAIVDSGVTVGHPHLPDIRVGLSIAMDGSIGTDFADRIGHGTAVAAAIHEKAPDAEILPVRVFERALETGAAVLVAAVDAAVERGAAIVNLSLGTPDLTRALLFEPCIARAVEAGALIVSPARHRDRLWLPGSLAQTVGVELDDELDRNEIRRTESGQRWAASGYPRPIPGVDPKRNLRGVSFAAANVSGLLARALQAARISSGCWTHG